VLEVATQSSGRDDLRRLDVVAEPRFRITGGMLEAVTGRDRERKHLVHPETRPQRQDEPEQGRDTEQGERHDAGPSPPTAEVPPR